VGDTALLASSRWGGRIVRIDEESGQALWTYDGARAPLLSDDDKGAVWAVVDKPLEPPARIVELDPLTGKQRRSVGCPRRVASFSISSSTASSPVNARALPPSSTATRLEPLAS